MNDGLRNVRLVLRGRSDIEKQAKGQYGQYDLYGEPARHLRLAMGSSTHGGIIALLAQCVETALGKPRGATLLARAAHAPRH